MAENPESAGQPAIPPTPRRAAISPERAQDSDQRDQIASLADSVQRLASQLGASQSPEPPPAEPERSSRRKRKFQRIAFSTDPRPDALPADALSGDAATADVPPEPTGPAETASDEAPAEQKSVDDFSRNKNIAWPRLARAGYPSAVAPRRKRRSTLVPMLVLLGCNLFMLVFGFLVGQSGKPEADTSKNASASPTPSSIPQDALGPRSVDEKTLATINSALQSEKTGDPNAARRLYNDAIQRRITMPGAEYRLALLAIQRGDLLDADLHLVRSTTAGECVAACDYVRATFAGSQGNFAEAGRQLTAATRIEPFNAKYFFCLGECLRRQGKPMAAITVLQQSLDRAYAPEDGDLYLFKFGLAKIEAGHDDEFDASLANHLKQPHVSGDWWLLAAAQDLERAAYPAAADHLEKASRAMPAALFESRVRDYLFQAHARQPEVTAYLGRPVKVSATEAGASVMDPATWPPDKADPGTWPTGGGAGH